MTNIITALRRNPIKRTKRLPNFKHEIEVKWKLRGRARLGNSQEPEYKDAISEVQAMSRQ